MRRNDILSRRGLLRGSLSSTGALLTAGLATAASATETASGPDPTIGRTLVFEEPFRKLDQSIWRAGPKATIGPSGFYGRSAFVDFAGAEGFTPYRIVEDPLASDGRALEIAARYIGHPMRVTNYYGNNDPDYQWISGNLQTASPDGTVTRGWRQGYFEARMRFPAHPLTWPAFWLLNKNAILRPDRSIEIDVVEHKGWEPHLYGAYLHEWGKPGEHHEGTGVPSPEDLTAGYSRYGFLVADGVCTPFLERRPAVDPASGAVLRWSLGRASEMEATGDLFWPLLTLALRNDGPYPNPLRAEDRLTAMRVDYVHVYA